MLQREKGERKFQKQMQVAEREGKEIKACCRGKREKGSLKNKCRSLRGRGKDILKRGDWLHGEKGG